MKPLFSKGDRVYYRDNGPEDTGTVIWVHAIPHKRLPTRFMYEVKWDNEDPIDEYTASQIERV